MPAENVPPVRRAYWTMGIAETAKMLFQTLGQLRVGGYLDEKFLDRMGKKFDETRRSYTKAFTFVLTSWVLLALSTATVPFSVTFLGFSVTNVDLQRLREIVLVIAASMSTYYIIRVLQMQQIKLIVEYATHHIYGTDKLTTELVMQSYLTLDENWLALGMTRTKPVSRYSLRMWFVVVLAIVLVLFLTGLFLAWEGMQFFVIYHVFAEPKSIALLSYAAGVFAIIMNLFNIGLFAYYLVPYKRSVRQNGHAQDGSDLPNPSRAA